MTKNGAEYYAKDECFLRKIIMISKYYQNNINSITLLMNTVP
jgi:hypothetical protein